MKKIILFILFLLLIVLFIWGSIERLPLREEAPEAGLLEIRFLDIGQGDATFITFEDGQQMLIDCAVDARILEALGRAMPFFDRSIDYLLVTHPDLDHYGGCIDVLERFEVREIIVTGAAKDNAFYNEFVAAMDAEQAAETFVETSHTWQIASTTLTFLFPDRNIADDTKISANNGSIIMRLDRGEHSVLLTGDAEEEIETYLVEHYAEDLDVDILKAGHHGAANASTDIFLDVVTPTHTVISSGVENRYGHPSARVIKRLERVTSSIWRTDTQGDIIAELGGQQISIYEASD